MSTACLGLAVVGETVCEDLAHMPGEPPGPPGSLPLIRFADKALRAFPTPLHAHGATEVAE